MGTPSVPIGGSDAADGITDGYNGYLCADDPRELCRVMREALSQPDRLAQIGRRAKETLPLAWEGVMQDVVSQYERIIDAYQGRPDPHQA